MSLGQDNEGEADRRKEDILRLKSPRITTLESYELMSAGRS